MKNNFSVSYTTTLPKEGNAPRVTITGTEQHTYRVDFCEFIPSGMKLVSSGTCITNQTIIAKAKQWYTQWVVIIYDENNQKVFSDTMVIDNEVVFIKVDAWALGDTIAWIPYIEAFRVLHKCKVICSTFWNGLLINSYPDIMFINPNTIIENIYAQYYIGASNEDNPYYSPIKVGSNPLQKVASSILGLPYVELEPHITSYGHIPRRMQDKYVTLSEYGSDPNKSWKAENGWQKVVDYLVKNGFRVLVISKEKTNLTNILDLTGDISIHDRAIVIKDAEFHLGVSSGLSWLAWAVGTHVVMISDVTPNWHEFSTNITRINANELNTVNYLAEGQTEPSDVTKKLEELIVSGYL